MSTNAAGWGTVRSVGSGLLSVNSVHGLGWVHVGSGGFCTSSSGGIINGSDELPAGRITGSASLPTGA